MTHRVETDPGPRWVAPALAVAVCAISFAAIFFRKAQPTHPLVAAGIRLAVAALCLAPMAARSIARGKATRRLACWAALAGIAYGLHFGAWVASLSLTSVAASVTLVTTTPILLAGVALVTGRDRPGGAIWIALAIAFAGLLLIGGADLRLGSDALVGDGLAIAGAVAIAIYLTIGRRLGGELDLWLFSAIATAAGAAALLGTAAVCGIPIRAASREAFYYLVLAALVPQLIGHNLLTWALRHTQPATVAMAVVAEPVGAAALGWIWLGESVTMPVAAGCALTLAAVILAIRARRDAAVARHPAATLHSPDAENR